MHTNVYSEDMAIRTVKVVQKKGFVGLQIKIGDSGHEQVTFWHKSQSELMSIFDQFSVMLEMKCLKHPKYMGVLKPKVNCGICWVIYDRENSIREGN